MQDQGENQTESSAIFLYRLIDEKRLSEKETVICPPIEGLYPIEKHSIKRKKPEHCRVFYYSM